MRELRQVLVQHGVECWEEGCGRSTSALSQGDLPSSITRQPSLITGKKMNSVMSWSLILGAATWAKGDACK